MFKAIIIIILLIIIIVLSEIISAIDRLNSSIKEISNKEKECKEKLEPKTKACCSICGKELEGECKAGDYYICFECYNGLAIGTSLFQKEEKEVMK